MKFNTQIAKNFLAEYGLLTVISVLIIYLPFAWDNKGMLDASLLPRLLVATIGITITSALLLIKFIRGAFKLSVSRTECIIFSGLGVYLLMQIISSVNAINIYEALFHIFKEFTFGIWFFIVYVTMKNQPKSRDILIKSLMVMGGFFIAFGCQQLLQADFTPFKTATSDYSYYFNLAMNKIISHCSNKNLFSSMLLCLTPLCLYEMLRGNIIWRIIASIELVLSIVFIALLSSRATWMGVILFFGVSFSAVYYYIFVVQRRAGKKRSLIVNILAIAIPLILLCGATGFIIKNQTARNYVVEKISNALSNDDNPDGYNKSTHMRVTVWNKTMQMVKEHPFIGSGAGQWQLLIPKYGVDEFEYNLRDGSLTFQRPHNDILWILSENGIIGLFGYLLFLFGIMWLCLRNTTKGSLNSSTFGIIAIGFFVGFIAVSFCDFPHERVEHNLMYLTIAAIVLFDSSDQSKSEPKSLGHKTSIAIGITALVLLSIASFVTYKYYNGEVRARKILSAYYQANWDRVIKLTNKIDNSIYTINNYSAPIQHYRGHAYILQKKSKEAAEAYKKGLEYAPYHIISLTEYASSLVLLNQNEEAEKYYLKALDISPRNNMALLGMSVMRYNQNKYAEATDYLKNITPDEALPSSYKKLCAVICRLVAKQNLEQFDAKRLEQWLADEERQYKTFQKFRTSDKSITEILMSEIGATKGK
ncbi:MAG: O-antigen ligase family protein [Salinivirgaceae bacterium]|nr:O-antigen ligase family protein [Salinivirgaceae bacterium]